MAVPGRLCFQNDSGGILSFRVLNFRYSRLQAIYLLFNLFGLDMCESQRVNCNLISFYHMGPEDHTLVARLSTMCPYLLTYLTTTPCPQVIYHFICSCFACLYMYVPHVCLAP